VAQVVQPDPLDPGSGQRRAPPVDDRVLVRRDALHAGGEPPVEEAQLDVLGEHLDECVGEVDGALRVVLRQPDVDLAALEALDLPADVDLTSKEVDVADLERGGLTEA
jgi:hypothetical protein